VAPVPIVLAPAAIQMPTMLVEMKASVPDSTPNVAAKTSDKAVIEQALAQQMLMNKQLMDLLA
jgi:hypothetical protein